jgi:uncharacterized protein (DUF934 family)
MPLLRRGRIEDDVWTPVGEGQEPPERGAILVCLDRFRADHERLLAGDCALGVSLANTDDPAEILPWISRISLIVLEFPKYTDGRAFSQAQLLRRRYGYAGEIRATGQVLRDQLRLMIRTGFDSMLIDEADAEAVYQLSAAELSEAYQAASDSSEAVFIKRQRARQVSADQ